MPEQPYEYYCTTCGGTKVGIDAFAYWNREEQKWDQDFRDYEYCSDCEYDCRTDQRPITDVKILAQIAIKKQTYNLLNPNP